MSIPYTERAGLFCDLYELTMIQGFFKKGLHTQSSGFDYFFRKLPFEGGYVVFAGLQDLLDTLESLRFNKEDLDYLEALGFEADFLEFLRQFRFRGTVLAAKEGDVVFPGEPILRLTGHLAETQLVETLLLNLLNFQSLIATKAARIRHAAGPDKRLLDFGLRRAQGLGGIHATRASIIGGFNGTSNVHAAQTYNIHAFGTMAHSWVQSFDDELTAFRAFSDIHPTGTVLLVDTYDTLGSGVPNAIIVASELKAKGGQLKGIRLDSGDLAYFARKARKMLDDAGHPDVQITASNQLDEHLVKSLLGQGAPIDSFGVGTRLVTGAPDAALDGVYKQCMIGGRPTMKVSENVEKVTLPSLKRVWRYWNGDGLFIGDAIGLDAFGLDAFGSVAFKSQPLEPQAREPEPLEPQAREPEPLEPQPHEPEPSKPKAPGEAPSTPPSIMHHPIFTAKKTKLDPGQCEPLLHEVMRNGEPLVEERDLAAIAAFSATRLARMAPEHLRFDFPHVYKVGISSELLALRESLLGR